MAKRTTTMWAIEGRWTNPAQRFLYVGTWLTRRDAIREFEANLGRTWAESRKRGNRAVKVTLTWESPDAP